MVNEFQFVEENLRRIRAGIEEAALRSGRTADEITLMAVTKTVAPEIVNHAVACGVTTLGENRVQEYLSKKDAYAPGTDMQFIGHLQTNKVKYIINDMSLIHSVDSLHLAQEIDRQAKRADKIQDILLEVNIGEETTKSGVAAGEVFSLAQQIAVLPHIRIQGLMAIPPAEGDEKFFAMMQEIFLDISAKKADNINMKILSMGMSGDYAAAIRYGATLVRIGSALFGARKYT